VIDKTIESFKQTFELHLGKDEEKFARWIDLKAIRRARGRRTPNIVVSTMGFYPGGAEILPIRMANEFKRKGYSVLLLSGGLGEREDGVRRMLRQDVPIVETSSIEKTREIIHDFGLEVLNSHQWHMQKYPIQVPDVFSSLKVHVASLHGMIEHGEAFRVTDEQLKAAHQNVSIWVYTADKNLVPFIEHGIYENTSDRFVKLPNGMPTPQVLPVSRAEMGIPEDAFVLCCVSRAIADKGWAEAIEAVDLARNDTGLDIRLILVGSGPVYDEYIRDGAPAFVHLAGFSENSVGYYAASDMGIMLTRFRSESFPLTIVDCLFAGKPYIACDVGEIRNMLTEGNLIAGSVIPLQDWVVPVKDAAEIVGSFAKDAVKYAGAKSLVESLAKRYSIDQVADQYLKLFQKSVYLSNAGRV
jgi:glycosyltransferase involved in cell wall biosynthesis